MAEEATIAAPEAGATETEPTQPAAAPPWGSDDEFDPKRAWERIQTQSRDIDGLRVKLQDAETKVRQAEDAKLTDQEKQARDADEMRTSNATLAAENALLKAVIAHPQLTADDIELLQGIPADAVAERAAKLAARLGSGTPSNPPSPRPKEALRGGTDPTAPAGDGVDWLRNALAKDD